MAEHGAAPTCSLPIASFLLHLAEKVAKGPSLSSQTKCFAPAEAATVQHRQRTAPVQDGPSPGPGNPSPEICRTGDEVGRLRNQGSGSRRKWPKLHLGKGPLEPQLPSCTGLLGPQGRAHAKGSPPAPPPPRRGHRGGTGGQGSPTSANPAGCGAPAATGHSCRPLHRHFVYLL